MSKKKKAVLKTYEVRLIREVEYHTVVEVEAESEDVAKDMAANEADSGRGYWSEGACLSHSAKVKEIK